MSQDIINKKLAFAVGILSTAGICYQLYLMYFLSIVQWHHFAFMVISIALLGFGAAGTVLTIFKRILLENSQQLLPLLMIITGVLMTLAVRLSRTEMVRFDSYLLFVDQGQFIQLLLTYLLFFLPFFTGALAIGLVFVKHVGQIGVYYFSDLVGAGIGSILAIVFFWILTPTQIPSAIALLPTFSGSFWGKSVRSNCNFVQNAWIFSISFLTKGVFFTTKEIVLQL